MAHNPKLVTENIDSFNNKRRNSFLTTTQIQPSIKLGNPNNSFGLIGKVIDFETNYVPVKYELRSPTRLTVKIKEGVEKIIRPDKFDIHEKAFITRRR